MMREKLEKTDLCILTKTLNIIYWEEDEVARFLDDNDSMNDNPQQEEKSISTIETSI